MIKLLLFLVVFLGLFFWVFRKYQTSCPYAKKSSVEQKKDAMCCGESGLEHEDLKVSAKDAESRH